MAKVVEEEHRLRALRDDVVHAHRHQVDPDGVVPVVRDCKLDLRADAVGAGDQHGLPIALERRFEQCTEAAQPGNDAFTRGTVRDCANACDQFVAAIDVHAGVSVAEAIVRGAAHGIRDGTGFIVGRGFPRAPHDELSRQNQSPA